MKKSNYIISILAAGLLLMVYSCSKEEVAIEKNSHKFEITDAKEVYNRIISFRNVVSDYRENPMYKSTELIDIDEMLWNLNATVNYEYSLVDDPYQQFFNQNVFYTITVQEENMVILGDAIQIYLEQEDDLAEALSLAPFTNKAIQFVFIRIDSIENQTVYLNSNISVGEKGIDGPGPFTADDDWFYGDDMGKCFDPQYAGIMDAADALEEMVESRRHIHIDDKGKNVFYANPAEVVITADHITTIPLLDLKGGTGYNNNKDFRLFYAHTQHNDPPGGDLSAFECIGYLDMNFYNSHLEYLVYNLIPGNQTYWPQAYNKKFVNFIEIDGKSDLDGYGYTYYVHEPKIVFAHRFVIEL